MVELITHLLNVTKRTSDQIDEINEEELNVLLELRDEVIGQLNGSGSSLSKTEKELLQKIGEYDYVIVQRMEYLKEEASQGLAKLQASQMQKSRYEQASASESYFIDRKE
ncbi:hypothetical protein [Paenibacillus spongiae]|uniref:Flagellar protein FliT n=1 Tax=Paenibacillus spongiae TaxID=2909671 RepID=A0ABY5S8P1_9BACL|nr:hypothetical protein [Paenibacillus spongiae]UVI29888.1 hypothetical protein L1F29_31650 [Paenibacillus spongiae]